MSAIDELQATIGRCGERIGPSVVGLGRGWHGGSGVVIGDGLVLTAAHNLRGDEATVTFGDGRREAARVSGVDANRDLAVLATDTGGLPAVEWAPEAVHAERRHTRRGAGQPRRPRAEGHARVRLGCEPQLSRRAGPARHRLHRAHRAAPPRVERQPDRGHGRAPARAERHPSGGRPDRRGARRAASTSKRSRAESPCARRGWAWRSLPLTSRAACGAPSAFPTGTASWFAPSRTPARPRGRASSRAT